jgi:hypothetical protein
MRRRVDGRQLLRVGRLTARLEIDGCVDARTLSRALR